MNNCWIDIVDNTEYELACYDDELLMECPLYSYVQVYDAFYVGRTWTYVRLPASRRSTDSTSPALRLVSAYSLPT